jgi:hypothetical protein
VVSELVEVDGKTRVKLTVMREEEVLDADLVNPPSMNAVGGAPLQDSAFQALQRGVELHLPDMIDMRGFLLPAPLDPAIISSTSRFGGHNHLFQL